MNQCVSDLFEQIYKAMNLPPNINESSLVTLIGPLVKAAIESKNEMDTLHIDKIIQTEGEIFVEKLQKQRIANELEFFKFQRFPIRSILQNYYECEQTDMTFRKLYNHLKPKCASINLTTDLLKSWLQRLGFCIIIAPHNREIVIEMHSQKMSRLTYIRKIQAARQSGQNIVYFREVTINLKDRTNPEHDEQELTVFFAANHTGLLNFAFVEKDMKTKENFVEWLTIISGNQPKQTVLVIEPKTFSSAAKPSIFSGHALPSAFKYERIWNNYNTFIPGVNEDADTIYSIEMLDFCWRIRDVCMISKKSLEDVGFDVIYLPCLHSELNPMHRIDFVKLIDEIDQKHQRIDIIRDAIRKRLDSSTTQEWHRYFEETIRIENDFLRIFSLSDEVETIEMDDSDVQIVDMGETVTLSDDDDDEDED